MIDFAAMFDQWAPSVQLSDYHRAQIRRVGVILAASIGGLNVALLLVAGLVWVLR